MVAAKKPRKKVSPFGVITVGEFIKELPASKKVVYPKGTVIFREGSKADSCCMILEGKIQISKKTRRGDTPIAVARVGEFLGEMAMLSGEKRSASVTALTRTKVILINHAEFVKLLRAQHPFAGRLALQLSSLLATRCSRLLTLIARQPQIVPASKKKSEPVNVQVVLDRVYHLWAV